MLPLYRRERGAMAVEEVSALEMLFGPGHPLRNLHAEGTAALTALAADAGIRVCGELVIVGLSERRAAPAAS